MSAFHTLLHIVLILLLILDEFSSGYVSITNKEYLKNVVQGSTIKFICATLHGRPFGAWTTQRNTTSITQSITSLNYNLEILTIYDVNKSNGGELTCAVDEERDSVHLYVYNSDDLITVLNVNTKVSVSDYEVTISVLTQHEISRVIYTPSYGGSFQVPPSKIVTNKVGQLTYLNLKFEKKLVEFLHYGYHSLTLISLPGIEVIETFYVKFGYKPIVRALSQKIEKKLENVCAVWSYPPATVTLSVKWASTNSSGIWNNIAFANENEIFFGLNLSEVDFEKIFEWKMEIKCTAINDWGLDVDEGTACIVQKNMQQLTLSSPDGWVAQGTTHTMRCQVPNYCDYREVVLVQDRNETQKIIAQNDMLIRNFSFSYDVVYDIPSMSSENEGKYTCRGQTAIATQMSNSVVLKMLKTDEMIVEIILDNSHGLVTCIFTALPTFQYKMLLTEYDFKANGLKESVLLEGSSNDKTSHKESVPSGTARRYRCEISNGIKTNESELEVCLISFKPDYVNLNMQKLAENDSVKIICLVPKCYFLNRIDFIFKPLKSHAQRILPSNMVHESKNLSGQEMMYRKFTVIHSNEEEEGFYTCRAWTFDNQIEMEMIGVLAEDATNIKLILYSTFGIFLFIILLAAGYVWYEKHKAARENYMLINDLRHGNISQRNPNLPIQDQAELLPLDSCWEIQRSCLTLRYQIGSGYFGVVMLAEANGIVKKDVTTMVAVKMAKKHSDGEVLRALISELKIMAHLGSHPHIVRLFGAVLDRLRDNEILVVMEYCKYGCLKSYLHNNRDRFVPNRNEAVAGCSSGEYKSRYLPKKTATVRRTENRYVTMGSSYTNFSQNEEDGYLKIIEEDIDLETMEFKTSVLVSWAFQVSRAMEWLANKKLIHGDLAARNVLLTSRNLVKISDFGLAKSMYNQQWYKRNQDTKVPAKWLALECVKDGVFSIRSDVWAYGILLWELFTLGEHPYHEFTNFDEIIDNLETGYRLKRPEHASESLYKIMLSCWQEDPYARPLFSSLSLSLYEVLEEDFKRLLLEVEAENENEHLETEYLKLYGGSECGYLEMSKFDQSKNSPHCNSIAPEAAVTLNTSDEKIISDYIYPVELVQLDPA